MIVLFDKWKITNKVFVFKKKEKKNMLGTYIMPESAFPMRHWSIVITQKSYWSTAASICYFVFVCV